MGIVLALSLIVFLGGYGSQDTGSVSGVAYPLTITDSTGTEVVIEKEPKKVVSFSPVVTETVAAFGKEDVLVGRTAFCDYPPAVESVPVVGDLTIHNMELVVGAEPDVVLASAFVDEGTKEQLKQLGIPLIATYSSESFAGAYDDIEMIGKVLNAKDKSKEVIDSMKSKVSSVESKVKEAGSKPDVYYVLGFIKGDFTATGETFINEMITMAGGTNIAADGTGWSYNKESLIEKNPDIIILDNMAGTIEDLKNTEGYKDLDAVKNNKVYLIDSNLINRTGPRLASGLEALAAIIHPDIFSK